MSDIENLDVMLGNYTNCEIRDQEAVDQIEIDPESRRRQRDLDQNEGNYRSLLNTTLSENSEITAETSRMINSEISSQMSKKIEKMKSDSNSHILEVINSAIEEKILPSIENVITSNREAKNTKWDLRSDRRHPDRNIQMTQNSDLESHGRHKSKFSQQVQDSGENFPKLVTTSSNQNNDRRENLVDFEQSDNDGYDTQISLIKISLMPASKIGAQTKSLGSKLFSTKLCFLWSLVFGGGVESSIGTRQCKLRLIVDHQHAIQLMQKLPNV